MRGACAAAVLVLGIGPGCGGDEERVDPVRERMREETGRLRQVLEEQPDSLLVHFQLAKTFQKYAMVDSARAAYERCVALYEGFPEAHFELAQIYYEDGLLEAAAGAYEQTLRFRADHAVAANNLGFVYKQLGELDRAEAAYERAIEADSHFVEAYNNLGQIYKQREKWEEAIALYERAIAIDPTFPEAYVNLSMVYRRRQAPEAEERVLRAYLQRFSAEKEHGAYARERLAELEGGEERAAGR